MSTSGVQGAAFMRSKYQPKDVKYPFIQFHLYSYSFGSGPNTAKHWKTFAHYDEKVFYYNHHYIVTTGLFPYLAYKNS